MLDNLTIILHIAILLGSYIVITREELSKKIDNYLNGKIERTAGVYAPLDLFNHIIKHRKVYSYEEAKLRARYLNKKYERSQKHS